MNSYNKKRFSQLLLEFDIKFREKYLMQYQIRQTRTSHQTLPYFVAVDCFHAMDTAKCGLTWDFRFRDQQRAIRWSRYLANLIKRIQKHRKQVDTAIAVL